MVIPEKKVFNLMDTNGRRKDVLNAYQIYLEILKDLDLEYPLEKWDKYPHSVRQILFYEKAVERSKDVFKEHKKYDSFQKNIGTKYKKLLEKNASWIDSKFEEYRKVIDESIEQRARHYTSNLVKLGFVTSERNITEVGYAFLAGEAIRDPLEELLPLDNINILLIRQLAKLKIFSKPNQKGERTYYAPFFMALKLLSSQEKVDKRIFSVIVQGFSPYLSPEDQSIIKAEETSLDVMYEIAKKMEIELLPDMENSDIISQEKFRKYFKSSKKSKEINEIYYDFYLALRDFNWNICEENYLKLGEQLKKNAKYLNKAFGCGKAIFQKESNTSMDEFLEKNKNHPLLRQEDFHQNFYVEFVISKRTDSIAEYSDTTIRLLSASGLVQFRNLPELAFEDVIKMICPTGLIANNIFGRMTKAQFMAYEEEEDAFFYKNISLRKILSYKKKEVAKIQKKVMKTFVAKDISQAKEKIISRKNEEFVEMVTSRFPIEKLTELLQLFSDRKNDSMIQKKVNKHAKVPTIYEYLVAIAWYYISDDDYNLYESLNLTLNADFEPVIHAGGGSGDIVISYENRVVMLEVTLMNKQAQKRGEWEPVLRHSLNYKAENREKELITFFIADELDVNTINIWRAVAAVPLESTSTHSQVDGVIIMPFTNAILVDFLQRNIGSEKIIEMTKSSFDKVPKISDINWHKEAVSQILD
ncbi:MAG: AlwI family type II restriction endonuclease [Eubacteriales bacterium]